MANETLANSLRILNGNKRLVPNDTCTPLKNPDFICLTKSGFFMAKQPQLDTMNSPKAGLFNHATAGSTIWYPLPAVFLFLRMQRRQSVLIASSHSGHTMWETFTVHMDHLLLYEIGSQYLSHFITGGYFCDLHASAYLHSPQHSWGISVFI